MQLLSFQKLILTLLCFIFSIAAVSGQAKNSIGFGPAINSSREGGGFGAILQGEIKVARAFAIVPAIGVEIPYVAYFSLAGKYYFQSDMYVTLGALAHLGGDDGVGDSGLGGTAGIGYELVSSKSHVLDLNLHGDVMQIDGSAAPVVGLRLTYNFSFSGRK